MIETTHIEDLVGAIRGTLSYDFRTGHPCLYDALRIACENVSPTSYLEIGVSDGASLLTVLHAAPTVRRVVLCDLWAPVEGGSGRGSHAHIDELLRAVGYSGSVAYLDGDSRELIPTLPPSPPFDLITVDGTHSEDAAFADCSNVWPLLRVGGILVVDDSSRPPIRQAMLRFSAEHAYADVFALDDGADATLVVRKQS